MFARQAQIAILSLLLSTFLSAQVSSTDGSCRDFTHGGCQMDQLFETVKDINESICQEYCNDIFTDKCTFFSFDNKQKLCLLFDTNFAAFERGCTEVGGPASPQLSQCQTDACDKFTEGYCHYDGTVITQFTTTDDVLCQTSCKNSATTCQYFHFDKETKNCMLYQTSDRTCDFVRGPPKPSWASCNPQ